LTENRQVLQQAINDGLLALGEPVMKTIQWHLKAHGIFIDSNEDVDLRLLYTNLQQIVGNIADVILEDVYANLSAKSSFTNERQQHHDSNKLSEPTIAKIEKLLQQQSKRGEG
jgi:hypothetical protein